jgi:hypothetical protein
MADGRKRILPIWHGVDRDDVAQKSPILASFLASNSQLGIEVNIANILDAMKVPSG